MSDTELDEKTGDGKTPSVPVDPADMTTGQKILHAITPRGVTAARASSGGLLVLGFLIAVFFREGFFGLLKKIYIPGFEVYPLQVAQEWWYNGAGFKATLFGFHSVHRIAFALVIYFTVHFGLSLPSCFPCCGPWAKFAMFLNANGCLGAIKYVAWFILAFIMFLLPDAFFVGIAWLSMIMSSIFSVIQALLLLDSAYSWHFWIFTKHKEDNPNEDEEGCCSRWILLELGLGLICYFFSLLMFGGMIAIFAVGDPNCLPFLAPILVTLILAIVVAILSFVTGSGFLPGAIVGCYCTFLCWNALLSYPKTLANGMLECNSFSDYATAVLGINTTAPSSGAFVNINDFSQIFSMILTIGFACFSIIYSACTASSSFLQAFMCCGSSSDVQMSDRDCFVDPDDDEETREEKKGARSLVELLFIFILASFLLGTALTNWLIPNLVQPGEVDEEQFTIGVSYTASAVRWACEVFLFIIFIWSTIWIGLVNNPLADEDDSGGAANHVWNDD